MKKKALTLVVLALVLTGTIIAISFSFQKYQPQILGIFGDKENENGANLKTTEPPHFEAVAKTERIVDGDTISVNILRVVDPHKGVRSGIDKIRFAGVDAEETEQREAAKKHENIEHMSQAEYEKTEYYTHALAAKNLVRSLTSGVKVYLDIDDLAGSGKPYRGTYNRLIAVVYVENDKEWININAKVLRQGFPEYVRITGFKSEFQPHSWLKDEYSYN